MYFFRLSFIVLVALAAGVSAPRAATSIWESVPDSVAASDTLSLTHALALVKRSSPLLRGHAHRVDGARSLVDQAGARPNPNVLFEAENVGGSYSGFDRSELSLRLEQEIELGGKRSKRIDVAQRSWEETTSDAEAEAFDLYLETLARYAGVLHAEEQLRLATATDTVVAGLAKSADDRVRVGATLMADASLATVARVRSRTMIDDAVADRARARLALSTLWSDTDGFDEAVAGIQPAAIDVSLPADSAYAWAAAAPSVRRLRLASATLRAEAGLQRGLRTPNIVLGGGGRRVEEDDAYTFLFDVALPLPLWDRKGGAIHAADAQLRASELTVERARAETSSLISARIAALDRARTRLAQTENELVPALTKAFENMRTAYAIGRASYADLLDVTRTLIELEREANDTRLTIAEERIAIERLAGRTIEELMTHE